MHEVVGIACKPTVGLRDEAFEPPRDPRHVGVSLFRCRMGTNTGWESGPKPGLAHWEPSSGKGPPPDDAARAEIVSPRNFC